MSVQHHIQALRLRLRHPGTLCRGYRLTSKSNLTSNLDVRIEIWTLEFDPKNRCSDRFRDVGVFFQWPSDVSRAALTARKRCRNSQPSNKPAFYRDDCGSKTKNLDVRERMDIREIRQKILDAGISRRRRGCPNTISRRSDHGSTIRALYVGVIS